MTADPETVRMLAEVEKAQAEMARRAAAPVWYHPALGLLLGGLVAIQGAPLPFVGVYYAAFGIGCLLLVAAYRRRNGMWINGYRKGRTRWVAVTLAVLFGAIMLGCAWLQRFQGAALAPVIGGALVAVIATIGGFVWEAAYRKDLADGKL